MSNLHMARTERREKTDVPWEWFHVDIAVVMRIPVVTHLYDQRSWKVRFPFSPLRRIIQAVAIKAREIILKVTLGD